MATGTQPGLSRYRLIITRREASEILLSAQPFRSSLPQVEVINGARLVEQLVASVKRDYRLDTYCLGTNSVAPSPEAPFPDKYAVLEALHKDDKAHTGTMWISLAAASEKALDPADQLTTSSWIADLNRYRAQPEVQPFAKPGWTENLLSWVRGQIEPLGLCTTGRIEQVNASATFSLVRIETTGGSVWFKAAGEPNVHELPISVALHRFFPNYVPRVLGVHPIWNGWLSEDVPGGQPEFTDILAWSAVARALARLQIASVSKVDALVKAGCKDMSFEQLTGQLEPFLARVSELMAVQLSEPPYILRDSELRFLGDRLAGALCDLQRHRIPATLGHLDFNPGNILVSPRKCCFLDWAEGCVAHPFVTFEFLREHWRRGSHGPEALTDRLVRAYLEPWQSFLSPDVLADAMSISPIVAVFACAVNLNVRSPQVPSNPGAAGYFRALARRTYREATKLATRSDSCLA
jgi:hypothetical protein